MSDSTIPRVDLLHAHGSPTCYLYRLSRCRCSLCRAAKAEEGVRYREAHVEERKEAARRYYAANRERVADNQRRRCRENPVKKAEEQRRWIAKNPGKTSEYSRRYYATHREERIALVHIRRAMKNSAPGRYTADDVRTQLSRQEGKCFWCGEKLSDYHVDHVVPLSKGGSNGPENIVVACPACNMAKGSKHPMEFAGRMF